METLCVFATEAEAGTLKNYSPTGVSDPSGSRINVIVSGVGAVSTAWHLKNFLCSGSKPDLIINAGIAGSFRESLPPGALVMPVSDTFADLGMEEPGGFRHLSTTPFLNADTFPFSEGRIICRNRFTDMLSEIFMPVAAVTVNTVTGTEESAERLRRLFNPDIETMEGAAVFYVCAMERIPCVSLRAVSNFAGLRTKGSWDTDKALRNLTTGLTQLFKILEEA